MDDVDFPGTEYRALLFWITDVLTEVGVLPIPVTPAVEVELLGM